MYNVKITIPPYQKTPPEKWIKDNLFRRVLDESDLMDKLLDGNKIVVELDFNNNINEYQMNMNLTYTQERHVEFDSRPIIDKDYMDYQNWKNKSKWKKLTTLIFRGF